MTSIKSLDEVLYTFMHQPGIVLTPTNLSNLSGVSKATILNWLDGLVKRPRRWQDVLKVADALRLSTHDVEELLAAAGHRPIAELYAHAASAADRALLLPWHSVIGNTIPPLDRTPNLAAPVTTLLGRTSEQATLRHLLLRSDVGLITLTGISGVGKTPLALSTAAELRDAFADGAWHINLASLNEPSHVVSAIAQVLGLSETPDTTLLQRLCDALRPRRMLFVLDNFDHVTESAPLIAKLVSAAAGLKIMVTSRSILHLYNETIVRVLPVEPSESDGYPTGEQGTNNPRTKPLVQGAGTVSVEFAPPAPHAATVTALRGQLDNMQRAIKLAATQTSTHSLAQALVQLGDDPSELAGNAVCCSAPQQLPHTAFESSYDLLDDEARVVFARLAVFAGGWTIAAAAEISADYDRLNSGPFCVPHPYTTILDILTTLIDYNFIVRIEREDRSRYTMLEPIRDYAAVRLRTSGEYEAIEQRHADIYLRYAGKFELGLTGLQQIEARTWLEQEQDNLRAALRWLLKQREEEEWSLEQ